MTNAEPTSRLRALAPFWWLHPVLFAVVPIIALVAANQDTFTWPLVVRSLVASLIAAAILVTLSRPVLPGFHSASLLATTILIIFFTYGHVYELTEDVVLGHLVLGRHRHLLPLSALLIGSLFLTLRFGKSDGDSPTWVLNVMGIVLLLFQTGSLIRGANLRTSQRGQSDIPTELGMPDVTQAAPAPDIYYIILDGYGRQDILDEVYGYDNSAFVEGLERRGFYVAQRSRSNYLATDMSIPSSLNMHFMQTLREIYRFPEDSTPVNQLVDHSLVRTLLSRSGYKMISFDTGFWATDVVDADIYIRTGQSASLLSALILTPGLNHFETLLLRTSAYRAVLDYQRLQGHTETFEHSYAEARERTHTIFSTLREIPDWPGRYFVFTHVLQPHPPFIFGPDGEPLTPSYPYDLADHSEFLELASREEYKRGYIGQLQYVNSLVEATVDEILEKSSSEPIIIIQGDHGPGAYFNARSLSQTYLPERTSILNAYYVPEEMAADLYPSITPVNSFRVIFRHLFDVDIELLPDHTYFSPYATDPLVISASEPPPD